MDGELSHRVVGLCKELEAVVGAGSQALLDDVRGRLAEPLRLAVAGRVSSGKSTLVNALLGSAVCRTGDAETTPCVTWFQGSTVERLEVVLRDGTRRRSALTDDGRLPEEYGVPAAQIDRVVVQLTHAPVLDQLTLIDTPGTESALTDASHRTDDALFVRNSLDAVAQADALLFVLKGLENDVAAVEAFSELTAGVHACLVNVVGVVNGRGDGDGGGTGELAAHARVAARLAGTDRLRRRMLDVVPVLGLLAQAGSCSQLTTGDMGQLHDVVAHPDFDDDIDFAPAFLTRADTLRRARERLFGLLGPGGLRLAAQVWAQNGWLDRSELERILLKASGLDPLRSIIVHDVITRADAIKADQALARLERHAYVVGGPVGATIRDAVEQLMLDPDMHGLREMGVLAQFASGEVDLPAPAQRLLHDLFSSRAHDPGAVRALERMAGSPRLAARARELLEVVLRSHHLREQEPVDPRQGATRGR